VAVPEKTDSVPEVRAASLLKVPAVWAAPVLLVSVLIFLVTLIYLGSLVDPASHLRSLPVLTVNEDHGTSTPSGRVDLGQQVVAALTQSPAVSTRLSLQPATLAQAKAQMSIGNAYAVIVIPRGFTRSVLALYDGRTSAGQAPSAPVIQLLTNPRAGGLGVSLATGIAQPALGQISQKIGQRLLSVPVASGPASTGAKALLANPITVAVVPYHPLPPRSALGLSAFYVSLLSILCGFMTATLVNSSIDSSLGYATSEVGPWWQQRLPLPVTRWQTLLAKWLMGAAIVPVTTALMLIAAIAILKMDAPYPWYLWLFTTFTAEVVAVGTLVLFAALGSLGQLVAVLFFLYLALASSGGTVPLQALPGFFRFVSNVDPLRQVLDGVRSILYFGAAGAAGLTRAIVLTCTGLVFWVVLGITVTTWYDRRGLRRMQPELMAHLYRSVREYTQRAATKAETGPRT
jgi:YhgE/Pip-like protein